MKSHDGSYGTHTEVAAPDPLSGVFWKLAQEHGELNASLVRLRMTSSLELRALLFPIFRDELLAHERGELEVVYATLERYDATHWIALAHRRHAQHLQRLIERVSELPFDGEAWSYAFAHLADTIGQHSAEEEDELFPTAQRVMGAEAAQTLLVRYELNKTTFVSH
jgi:Hemerythrin HHE cation binding domain